MRKLNKHERRIFFINLAKILAADSDFAGCVENIAADCELLLALDLGRTAREGIINILQNVNKMTAINNDILRFLKECEE